MLGNIEIVEVSTVYDYERLRLAHGFCDMLQNDEEILWAIKRVKEHIIHPARYFMEIGCAGGGSLVMWSSIMDDIGTMIGVTLDDDPDELSNKIKVMTGINTQIIIADAHLHSTKELVEKSLGKNKLSGLFIDEDKTFQGAADSYNLYSSLVQSPGFIAFHDIQPASDEGEANNPTCAKFYQWLKYHHSYEEKRIPNMWRGIGIIFV